MPKIRLDRLVVERGLACSVREAESLIRSGVVLVGDRVSDKPGNLFSSESDVRIRSKASHSWVSRGGVKLAHALSFFSLNPNGWVVADIGASTGGFTDVLLHHGARSVYAVDVGYGELAWKLRQDPRVVCLERTNARHLSRELLPDPLDAIVCDASFIRLSAVLPAVLALASLGTILIALIKPQFEVAAHEVGEGGIIRDPLLHQRVCAEVQDWLSAQGWKVLGLCESPITGAEGNVEFLIAACKGSGA